MIFLRTSNRVLALPASRRLLRGIVPALLLTIGMILAGCGRAGTSQPATQATRTAGAGNGTPTALGSPSTGNSATPRLIPQAGGESEAPLVLSDLHMISANEGWATGWTADRSSGGILRTVDGGAHWLNASPAGIDPTQIETTDFFDATHAWLVLSSTVAGTATPTSGNATVLSTRDGGLTWQYSAPIHFTSAAPGWLNFIDREHGWLMANLGASAGAMAVGIYRTTDGGLHWENVSLTAGDPKLSSPNGLPLECNKTGISFVNATTGWATGHCTQGGVFFFVTHDGGRSWQPQLLRPPADLPPDLFQTCDCETTPPSFASAQNGLTPVKIFTTQHEAVLYVTSNGGQNWSPSQLATNRLLRPPDFVSPADGWVTDEERVYVTHDGGRTWSVAAHLPSLRLLGTFDFVNMQNGWVTGGEAVYRTTDGAKTWQELNPRLAQEPPGTRSP